MSGDELASYLAASVTYEPKRTLFPAGVLAERLATREWHTAPTLASTAASGDRRGPNFGSPSPLTVEALHELPFPCRWD